MDTVVAAGYLPLVRGMRIYLITPRTMYSSKARAKKLVYGRNLNKMSVSRKLGGSAKVPTIEIRCADPSIGKTRWARAPVAAHEVASGIFGEVNPPKASRANDVSPGGTAQEQIRVIPISGVSDAVTMERIAQNIYEQIGRQEIEGSFETCDITSFESEDEGDLLDLQAGDPVELLIAPLNDATTGDDTNTLPGGSLTNMQELHSFSVSRRAEFLRSIGFTDEAAQRLSVAQEQVSLNTIFRSQTTNINWSQEDGITIEGDFVNFVVVREDSGAATLPAGVEAATLTAGATTSIAAAVRDSSSAGNSLGAQAQAGEVSGSEYGSQSAEERARQQRLTQALRRVE